MQLLRIRIITHSLFWLTTSYLSSSVLIGYVPLAQIIWRALGILLLHACLAYGNMLWLVPRFFLKGKYALYLLWLLLFSLPIILLRAMLEKYILSGLEFQTHLPQHLYATVLISSSLAILIISLGYALAENYFINQSEKINLEKQHLEAETNFLRSQINPHFLFNTLNNVYTLSLMQSPRTSDTILKLSQLMRFMLYDAAQKEIPLEKEIQYINDFLALEMLRYEAERDLHFEVEIENSNRLIAPLLLIPLVENSLKYANLPLNPEGSVHFKLIQIPDGKLCFETKNTVDKSRRKHFQIGGIGLTNLRKRLDMHFGKAYTLHLEEKESYFWVQLIF